MGGETERNISGWTVDTLRAHVFMLIEQHNNRYEARFIAQEKAVLAAMHSAAEAINKAEEASSKRADKDNEFRGQLKDQASMLMPRMESERLHGATAERITELAARLDARLSDIVSRLDRSEGKGGGMNALWIWAVAAIATIASIMNIFMNLRAK